jgi:putative phosphoribosyl transferase
MFEDRKDAGKRLAGKLERYRNQKPLVLAIPRGGVEVGLHVAHFLEAEFSIIVSRKLPFPFNRESGFGAISEDGSLFLFPGYEQWVTEEEVTKVIETQKEEMRRRISILRNNRPLPKMDSRTVILIDDGIAMGSTMRVSITLCRNKNAKRIVVAVPVTSESTARQIGQLVDEIIVLEKPSLFRAVAQVYRNWYDVSDEEVIRLMKKWKKNHT